MQILDSFTNATVPLLTIATMETNADKESLQARLKEYAEFCELRGSDGSLVIKGDKFIADKSD